MNDQLLFLTLEHIAKGSQLTHPTASGPSTHRHTYLQPYYRLLDHYSSHVVDVLESISMQQYPTKPAACMPAIMILYTFPVE